MLEAVVLAAAHRCTYGRREPQVVQITTASRVSGARIGRLLRRPTVPASPTLGLTHLFDAMLTASQESTDSSDFRSRALEPLEVHTSSNVHGIDQWIPWNLLARAPGGPPYGGSTWTCGTCRSSTRSMTAGPMTGDLLRDDLWCRASSSTSHDIHEVASALTTWQLSDRHPRGPAAV